jgi:hypothetical protein
MLPAHVPSECLPWASIVVGEASCACREKLECNEDYSSSARFLLSLRDLLEMIVSFSPSQWTKEKRSTAEYSGIRFQHRRP